MKEVILKPLQHRGAECIGICFEINFKIQGALQKTGIVKFSGTNKCWYTPLSKENYKKIALALKGLATIEQSALHQYLSNKKKPGKDAIQHPVIRQHRNLPNTSFSTTSKNEILPQSAKTSVVTYKGGKIYPVNTHVIASLEQQLILKGYSSSTRKTYINEVGVFLKTIHQHPADTFSTQRIKDYLQYCAEALGLTENTLHSRMNALKFYYEQVLKEKSFFGIYPGLKKATCYQGYSVKKK